jgi:predicted nuclease with TOPRIM domain
MEFQERNSTNTQYFWLAIGVLLALSAGLGYLYMRERQINQTKQELLEQQIQDRMLAKQKIDSITRELSAKILEINKLGGEVASLKKVKDELESDKNLLNAKKITDFKAFDLKINDYQKLLDEKDREISRLKADFGKLANKNEALNSENIGLKSERQQLSDSINAVTERNKLLAEKVTEAAALRAETINVYAISGKGKEKEGGNYNARKIEKLRIAFHLVDNPLTKLEDKEILMRLLDPSGSVQSDMAAGSGIFRYRGQEVIYTIKKTERYTNNHQTVEIIYNRSHEYRQGRYNIELYCEGFLIGRGSFEVK